MKPRRIILIRHGESAGNVDKRVYLTTPDYAVPLTDNGRQQADEGGKKLHALIGRDEKDELFHHEGPFFYVSPYFRTRETFEIVAKYFPYAIYREDVLLREQEWANSGDLAEIDRQSELRDGYGPFYYRLPGGESGADVYGRVSTFIGSLHRDFNRTDFPDTAVIIGHGLLNRLFLMRWLRWTVEEFEMVHNPDNAGFFILEKQANGRYALTEEPKKYETAWHNYQRPIQLPHPKTQRISLQRVKE